MMKSACLGLLIAGAVGIGVRQASAQAPVTLLQWNFNAGNTVPSTLNSNFNSTPSIVTLGPTLATTPVESFVTAADNNSSDPATGSNLALQIGTSWPLQSTANKAAGIEFFIDTTNKTISQFSFDFRPSGGPSGWQQVQYTLDGTNWIDDGTPIQFFNNHWVNQGTTGNGSLTAAGGYLSNPGFNPNPATTPANVFDFSGISAASNNPHFGIRDVAVFSPQAFTANPGTGSIIYASNTAYQRADQNQNLDYTPSSTWRFDMVTLTGVDTTPAFTPSNLTWNTTSGTWDTSTANKPWLKGATASSFSQASPAGDNVAFNNPAAGSMVTVQAAGVTPNSITINNSGTLTFTGGSIQGTGGLSKSGAGRLIMANSNSFTGANFATAITAGTIETQANSSLGSGAVSIGNATWNSTTATQSSPGAVTLTGPVTFDTTTDLTLGGGLAGAGGFQKQGAGMLAIGGVGTDSGPIQINAGTVRLDSMGALGGNATTATPAPMLTVSNATLVANATGKNGQGTTQRLSSNITLNSATIQRAQLTANLGSATTNGDSEFTAYTVIDNNVPGEYVGSTFTVNGNSSIVNLETRTAAFNDAPNDATQTNGSSNALVVRMPITVSANSTLTLTAVNGAVSQVPDPNHGGSNLPSGNLGNTSVALRSPGIGFNSNDSVTLLPGSSLILNGAGEKRIGASAAGKLLIGTGTPGSEATFRADNRTYMTDLATIGNNNSLLLVGGSGTAGLRIEAPLHADYSATLGQASTSQPTSGLFGTNPDIDSNPATIGNVYTILSPNRYAALSGFDGMPTTLADGTTPFNVGGTLTIAATDAAGGTGAVDNGPAVGTVVKFGVDNTATSGNLIYTIDPAANGAAFTNFGGLVVKQSFTGNGRVTAQLLGNTTLQGANSSNTTFDQSGGTLDLNGHLLTVGAAATLSGGRISSSVVGGASLTAGSIVKNGSATHTVDAGITVTTAGSTTINGGTLQLNGTSNLQAVTGVGNLGVGDGVNAATLTANSLQLGSLNIAAGGKVSVRVGGGLSGTSVLGALTIAGGLTPTGTLDIGDHTVIVHNGSVTAVAADVKSGSAADWTGPGITSSDAHTVSNHAVGYGLASDLGLTSAGGVPVIGTDVVIRDTNFGDANLDGKVDFADFVRLSNSFGQTGTDWSHGDFNGDHVTDFADFVILSNNFGSQFSSGGFTDGTGFDPTTPIQLQAPTSPVPEPSSMLLLGIGALIAGHIGLRRRRNKSGV